MSKKSMNYIRQNGRYYQDYVMGRREEIQRIGASIYIVVCAVIYWCISRLCLFWHFLNIVAKEDIGTMEVMEWIDKQMLSSLLDISTIVIIIITVSTILFIRYIYKKIKGYDLYKKKWIRIIPGIVGIVLAIFSVVYFFRNESPFCAAISVIDIWQVFAMFKILLPLELRESYQNIIKILEWSTKKIIRKS